MNKPKLRDDIELLRGMDDRPLAYDPRTGVYHHLSEPAFALAKQLDGTVSTADLAQALARSRKRAPEEVLGELEAFVAALDRGGVLENSAVLDRQRRRNRFMPRFVVTRGLPRLLEPLAAVVRRVVAVLMWTLTLAGVAGAVFCVLSLSRVGATPGVLAITLALLLFTVEVMVHELAHALVAQVLRVPVRGAGFMLMLWFLPFAFVDRTDAYRLRPRSQRVSLALVGPLLDGVLMGITSLIARQQHGLIGSVAAYLMTLQVFALLMNLNPLLAGDGYGALEAGLGLVDPRGRAFALLSRLVRARPLPPHLAGLSWWARIAYLSYALGCFAYLALAVVLLASAVW